MPEHKLRPKICNKKVVPLVPNPDIFSVVKNQAIKIIVLQAMRVLKFLQASKQNGDCRNVRFEFDFVRVLRHWPCFKF